MVAALVYYIHRMGLHGLRLALQGTIHKISYDSWLQVCALKLKIPYIRYQQYNSQCMPTSRPLAFCCRRTWRSRCVTTTSRRATTRTWRGISCRAVRRSTGTNETTTCNVVPYFCTLLCLVDRCRRSLQLQPPEPPEDWFVIEAVIVFELFFCFSQVRVLFSYCGSFLFNGGLWFLVVLGYFLVSPRNTRKKKKTCGVRDKFEICSFFFSWLVKLFFDLPRRCTWCRGEKAVWRCWPEYYCVCVYVWSTLSGISTISARGADVWSLIAGMGTMESRWSTTGTL